MAMAQQKSIFPQRTLMRMQRSEECALANSSSFPDLSWTKKKSVHTPQDPPKRFPGPGHIQDYAGHKPLKFNPFDGKHLEKSSSAPTLIKKKVNLPRAALTASEGQGSWYGHVGSFPSPVDDWRPAHYVNGAPP
eukprot:TRINITY_DN3280_c0_g1_i1.p1 TRINITY_DN3280_c0_g1~~TRINITY_DN3280_c0_g1_i1.p1  ORF type:complete len:134 (-),score=18.46 TRINITY_DN3280_c0_g1_i1:115-516(-)